MPNQYLKELPQKLQKKKKQRNFRKYVNIYIGRNWLSSTNSEGSQIYSRGCWTPLQPLSATPIPNWISFSDSSTSCFCDPSRVFKQFQSNSFYHFSRYFFLDSSWSSSSDTLRAFFKTLLKYTNDLQIFFVFYISSKRSWDTSRGLTRIAPEEGIR